MAGIGGGTSGQSFPPTKRGSKRHGKRGKRK